jgi:hypothetical protein
LELISSDKKEQSLVDCQVVLSLQEVGWAAIEMDLEKEKGKYLGEEQFLFGE